MCARPSTASPTGTGRGEPSTGPLHAPPPPTTFTPEAVQHWHQAGAHLIGGCCRVGPA
ncbi:homocysteine S-methyltransferase family protein, partial [Streptomyces sp. NRRL B-12105]|uniref:homocysteine S-methyltransferase family protein n=1 Tax=Streptomyces sp. NRRL B-12105 TaxID=1463827 RepID=UPI0018FEA554